MQTLNVRGMKRSLANAANGGSDNSLDCQSLESSLKRVRLSRSPGEIRLERDLRQMSKSSWEQVGDERWVYRGRYSCKTTPVAPYSAMLEQSMPDDALRLTLTFQNATSRHVAWIQIPRMYPHRPPCIPRLESSSTTDWRQIQKIIIQEAPPVGHEHSVSTASCGSTIVYNQWSPVMQLEGLLDFLLDAFQSPDRYLNRSSHRAPMQPSTLESLAQNMDSTYNDGGRFANPNEDQIMDGGQSDDLSGSQFVEEHKIEDGSFSGLRSASSACAGAGAGADARSVVLFPPNRFDMGYRRYKDPRFLTPSGASNPLRQIAPNAAVPNCMDMS